jgi:putative nucleotidyltransferase with HDIG domain
MAIPQKMVVDETKIKKVVLSGLPLTITTFTLPREIEIYIEEVVTVFLKMAGQEKLKDYVVYCIRELATNAKKANTKRVYFSERGLNLSNPDEYREGMEDFKEITMGNITHFLQMQKDQGLYIKLMMQLRENNIHIEIRNNAAVIHTELIRIQDRLARSRQYESLDEALSQVLDDSEGAGLGLVILVLMLKKIGLDENCFDIRSDDKETIARIMLPLDQVHIENISLLSEAIVKNIASLPQFPDNLVKIKQIIADSNADIATVAGQIATDPALTADLLRVVNSAHYMLIKRVDSISEAVKMVGRRGILNLLYSYGSQQILGSDSAEKKELWDHSYRTAFYAYNLVKNFKKDRDLLDDVYVGGILHDMGKIIFSNVRPKLLNRIKKFCAERNIPHSTFENLSAGMNHAEIGALIAEKWNFPDDLIAVIRCHHDPSSADERYRDLVESVYLANMFCEYEKGNVRYEQFDGGALASYGITDRKQLNSLIKRFSQGFKKESD